MNYADTINLFLQSMDTHRHTRTNTQMNCEPFGGLIQNIIYSYIVGENSENLLVCAGGGAELQYLYCFRCIFMACFFSVPFSR